MKMTIRFEKERVRVMVKDGPNDIDLNAKSEDVTVEITEHNFWIKVLQPFETIRAGISCAMMVHHVNKAEESERPINSEGG
ncbi:MAG: hypothetical protein M0R06_16815 [Sphaerochaeta sp.]|jgi:uncharacterized protein YneR|nr:hypothetical protein [Sphaerochaeta sp.]